ncbi:MAG: ABC transporter, partial [Limnohabitans sp.]
MASPVSLSGLRPFLRPYRLPRLVAAVCHVLAAAATLALPRALRQLIDEGLTSTAGEAALAAAAST